MPEDEEVETTESDEASETEEQDTDTEEVEDDPAAGLKKALAAERKARRDAERKAHAAETALADRDKEPAEQALEAAKREALTQAQETFNKRLVQAELKAALAGKVRNTALALKVIDTSAIEVDANGDIDDTSVTDAIDALLDEYPELAPDAQKFGSADQGAKGRDAKPKQITRSELANMTAEQIVKAQAEGRLTNLLVGNNRKG